MNLTQVTPVILTFNETPNLGRCLEKLRWASEVIVLDSGSTDGTPELAAAFSNVRVVQRAFDDHTSQWNHAISLATTPWILSLDADYILPDEFAAEVEQLNPSADEAAYFARFRYCVFGKVLRGSLYPPRAVLFQRDRCAYIQDGHTQLLRAEGPTGRLSGIISHDDRKPLSSWLRAQARYAELEARHLLETPPSLLNRADRIRRWIFVAPALVFCYTLIGKGLILDGLPGWYYVMQRTLAELMLSLHLMHRRLETITAKA
jgi:glycosyltransferase involved in cell wall biosynthesis